MKVLSDCCGATVVYGKRKITCKNCKRKCSTVDDYTDDARENESRGHKKQK